MEELRSVERQRTPVEPGPNPPELYRCSRRWMRRVKLGWGNMPEPNVGADLTAHAMYRTDQSRDGSDEVRLNSSKPMMRPASALAATV
jgi:hypothetical protein